MNDMDIVVTMVFVVAFIETILAMYWHDKYRELKATVQEVTEE